MTVRYELYIKYNLAEVIKNTNIQNNIHV